MPSSSSSTTTATTTTTVATTNEKNYHNKNTYLRKREGEGGRGGEKGGVRGLCLVLSPQIKMANEVKIGGVIILTHLWKEISANSDYCIGLPECVSAFCL